MRGVLCELFSRRYISYNRHVRALSRSAISHAKIQILRAHAEGRSENGAARRTLLGKVENSKIDGGARPYAPGPRGKTRRYCLKINGAECREKTTKKAGGVSRRRSLKSDSAKPTTLRSVPSQSLESPRRQSGAREIRFFPSPPRKHRLSTGIYHILPTFMTWIEVSFALLSVRQFSAKNWTR